MNDALDNFYIFDHSIIMSGDFNFIYVTNLDSLGGTPTLKLESLAEITKIREQYDLCDMIYVIFFTQIIKYIEG